VITTCRQKSPASGPQASLSGLCASLKVSRSWYYARPASLAPKEGALALRDAIERIVLDFPGYGYRRVTAHLRRAGWEVNHKRILRVMQQESLLCQLQRRFVVTTDSAHGCRVYPNLLRALPLSGPDQAWVADITYIRLPAGFCFLASLMDAFSRVCVGWQLSREIDARLASGALQMALAVRKPPAGLVHHSDRGVQYASGLYIGQLAEAQAQPSMSARGNPYDNAKAESFFKTLKREEVYLKHYQTFEEAKQNLSHFIEDVYNTKRLHSSLGYLPPREYEQEYNRTLIQSTDSGTCPPSSELT
jgi:transposase InsO family protein